MLRFQLVLLGDLTSSTIYGGLRNIIYVVSILITTSGFCVTAIYEEQAPVVITFKPEFRYPGSGSAHSVGRFLFGTVPFGKMVGDNYCRPRGLGQALKLVHQVGDISIGILVPVTEEFVCGIEDDQAKWMLGQVLFEPGA